MIREISKGQMVLKDALELMNKAQSRNHSFRLFCNCIAENGHKYPYDFEDFESKTGYDTPENFIKEVQSHGSKWLKMYDENEYILGKYQIVDQDGDPV